MRLYQTVVPIQPQIHGATSVDAGKDFSFAATAKTVPLVAAEFAAAARDMVIVFNGSGDDTIPVVLTGIDETQNLFLGRGGAWNGRYVPAYLRRYPFVLARQDDTEQMSLCLDTDHTGVNDSGRGQRLFDETAGRTGYLNEMLEFAGQFHRQYQRTQAFCRRLVALDLLEPGAFSLRIEGSDPRRISGFSKISRDKLKALPAETVTQMFQSGEMELCHLHLHSLGHLELLSHRRAARGSGLAQQA